MHLAMTVERNIRLLAFVINEICVFEQEDCRSLLTYSFKELPTLNTYFDRSCLKRINYLITMLKQLIVYCRYLRPASTRYLFQLRKHRIFRLAKQRYMLQIPWIRTRTIYKNTRNSLINKQ